MTLYDGYYVGPNTENKFYNYKAYSLIIEIRLQQT